MDSSRQCTAKSRSGKRCRKAAMKQQRVCGTHGGRAPQSIAAARRRLAALADPAAKRLGAAILEGADPVAIRAAASVLDRVGLGRHQRVELEDTSGPQRVEFVIVDPAPDGGPKESQSQGDTTP